MMILNFFCMVVIEDSCALSRGTFRQSFTRFLSLINTSRSSSSSSSLQPQITTLSLPVSFEVCLYHILYIYSSCCNECLELILGIHIQIIVRHRNDRVEGMCCTHVSSKSSWIKWVPNCNCMQEGQEKSFSCAIGKQMTDLMYCYASLMQSCCRFQKCSYCVRGYPFTS